MIHIITKLLRSLYRTKLFSLKLILPFKVANKIPSEARHILISLSSEPLVSC